MLNRDYFSHGSNLILDSVKALAANDFVKDKYVVIIQNSCKVSSIALPFLIHDSSSESNGSNDIYNFAVNMSVDYLPMQIGQYVCMNKMTEKFYVSICYAAHEISSGKNWTDTVAMFLKRNAKSVSKYYLLNLVGKLLLSILFVGHTWPAIILEVAIQYAISCVLKSVVDGIVDFTEGYLRGGQYTTNEPVQPANEPVQPANEPVQRTNDVTEGLSLIS